MFFVFEIQKKKRQLGFLFFRMRSFGTFIKKKCKANVIIDSNQDKSFMSKEWMVEMISKMPCTGKETTIDCILIFEMNHIFVFLE